MIKLRSNHPRNDAPGRARFATSVQRIVILHCRMRTTYRSNPCIIHLSVSDSNCLIPLHSFTENASQNRSANATKMRSHSSMVANTSDIVRLTSVITEPERVIIHFKTRASPDSCASHCYPAFYEMQLVASTNLSNLRVCLQWKHQRGVHKDQSIRK